MKKVILKIKRIKTVMPKTKMNIRGWTRTNVEHCEIVDCCCENIVRGLDNEWFCYNPKTLHLSMYESEYDEYGDLEREDYFDLEYCPSCGAKIEVELVSDVERVGTLKQDVEEKQQVVRIIKNERIEWEEKDLML